MDKLELAIEALRAIRGPADDGRFIGAYRDVGGGYVGLQAIAEAALELLEAADTCPVCQGSGRTAYFGGGPLAELRSCSACGTGEKVCDTLIPAVRGVN